MRPNEIEFQTRRERLRKRNLRIANAKMRLEILTCGRQVEAALMPVFDAVFVASSELYKAIENVRDKPSPGN